MKIPVKVVVTPASGAAQEYDIEYDTSKSVREVLEAASITIGKNMQVSINGAPVPADELKKKHGMFGAGRSNRVDVTERASGS